jgi:hypothetical protein
MSNKTIYDTSNWALYLATSVMALAWVGYIIGG